MYAVIRRYQSDAGRLDEIRRLIDEDFLPQLTGVQGFVSYYAFDDGTGDVATVSVFLTKEKADESVALAREWVQEHGGLLPSATEIFGGEVFSHGGS